MPTQQELKLAVSQEEYQSLIGSDPILDAMLRDKIPLTRAKYLQLSHGSAMVELEAEEEAMLPEPLQLATLQGSEQSIRPSRQEPWTKEDLKAAGIPEELFVIAQNYGTMEEMKADMANDT